MSIEAHRTCSPARLEGPAALRPLGCDRCIRQPHFLLHSTREYFTWAATPCRILPPCCYWYSTFR